MKGVVMDKSTGDPADPRWFRQVLGQYPTGVCVVTATEPDGRRAGFVVGSFTSVSLNPPLVAFFPDRGSTSWPRIRSAGKFCVNILSAEQEDICRTFASRKEDKFVGVACREAESGSPIITDAVAWIDCDLESVTEAGDHYIVLGRVRRLDVGSVSLPLLFFKGGYGRFAPLSLAAAGRGLITQLRDIDLVRPEMDRIAADVPGARCNASALVDDEIVVLASAGELGSMSPATFVGERLPFIPPLGRVFAAWMDDAGLENWLKHLPSEDARAAEREWLASVRGRGFSAILRTDAWQELESTRARLAADPKAVDREDLHGQIRNLDHDFVTLSPEVKTDIGVIRVPVLGRDDDVAMQLSVYLSPEQTAAEAIDKYIERVRIAGRRATELLGGRMPPTD
jgi:flavin reductase (DIM6/NTAB) family NADH-FMN oxidoreductase RutF/DNA-binding IclR family transcriptional regulator